VAHHISDNVRVGHRDIVPSHTGQLLRMKQGGALGAKRELSCHTHVS
jgi:hypothetical protein